MGPDSEWNCDAQVPGHRKGPSGPNIASVIAELAWTLCPLRTTTLDCREEM